MNFTFEHCGMKLQLRSSDMGIDLYVLDEKDTAVAGVSVDNVNGEAMASMWWQGMPSTDLHFTPLGVEVKK
jgi:hypothetical protein